MGFSVGSEVTVLVGLGDVLVGWNYREVNALYLHKCSNS